MDLGPYVTGNLIPINFYYNYWKIVNFPLRIDHTNPGIDLINGNGD